MIKHPEQYNLEPGIGTMEPDASVYGVAVTHQYHCLVGVFFLGISPSLRSCADDVIGQKMMRESFLGLSKKDPEYLDMLTAPKDPYERPPPMLDHVMHCFDYLRQSIICAAE